MPFGFYFPWAFMFSLGYYVLRDPGLPRAFEGGYISLLMVLLGVTCCLANSWAPEIGDIAIHGSALRASPGNRTVNTHINGSSPSVINHGREKHSQARGRTGGLAPG